MALNGPEFSKEKDGSMSTNVEDIGRMTEGVMRVSRQEVGRPPVDERTRSQAHM